MQRLHQVGVDPGPGHRTCATWCTRGWWTARRFGQAGWRPGYGNEAALRVLLDQRKGRHAVAGRRIARKEATITAAGATVAVIGTAAIVRRARRRHRGES